MLAVLRTSALIAAPCQADLNGDGKVNAEDLGIMRAELGRDNCHIEPCQADLNGDGNVNFMDIALLKAALGRDDSSSANVDIPQTGLDTKSDTSDEKKEVAASHDIIEDEDLEEGSTPPTTRFKDNGDGTVTDPKTGLMWTEDANLPGDTMLFHQAIDYINGMNEGENPNFGYTDWRLPTLRELRSLIDYTNYTDKSHVVPSGHPFQNVQSLKLNAKSSVTYLSNSEYPMFFSLYCRLVGHNVKSCYGYIWPVRGGKR